MFYESKMMRNYFCILCAIIATLLGVTVSRAELEINVTRGTIEPMPIAIPTFMTSAADASLGDKISEVITNDLRDCGLFIPVDPGAFIQDPVSLQQGPHFSEWRLIKADSLVVGKVEDAGNGNIRVEFRVFDVVREAQIEGKAFTGTMQEWRRIAHKVADSIYKRIIGDEGYFDTQIVYVSREKHQGEPVERIAIMDQDGANMHYVTAGDSLVLSPRFSPDMRFITFTDFGQSQHAHVYLMNLETRQKMLMGNFPGLTFAPRFSPDGTRLVMSFARGGVTSLYAFDMQTRQIHQLTRDPVIDTSPSYSPDGSKIVFNSDRGGQTHLYVMNANGGNVERISFGQGSYRTPVWSPRGDLIVFTKILAGTFYIGVMRPDGSGERLITSGYLVESPCWCPNGRVILFTREAKRGDPRLYSIDITGYNEREIPTPTSAAHGSWSPLIP
jgi:TolB protein